jgi:hypothetical protein
MEEGINGEKELRGNGGDGGRNERGRNEWEKE